MSEGGYVILVVEDKKSMARMLTSTLESEGYSARTAGSAEEGMELMDSGRVDLLLSDLKLPGMSGMELLKKVKEQRPMLPVIIMTAFGSIELAVEAVKAGAYDFLTKPFDTGHMLVLVERALESARLASENMLLKDEFADEIGAPRIIGGSRAIKEVVELIGKAAPTKAAVLLTGESGTGKEVFARTLHHLSPRSSGPFVPINCAAIPRDLLESELFGHEKGAFTGADARKVGKFELADKGTVFLDEIAEMDMGLQAKLLRVLQGERIERVGGTSPINVDVRVVSATNRDIARAVASGAFREDLFYRLNVFPVHIPALRERREDIPLLAKYFAGKFARELGRTGVEIIPEAMDALMAHNWRGNVRELENSLERAVILAGGNDIGPAELGLATRYETGKSAMVTEPLQATAGRAAREAEERAIRAALQASDGNKTKAAELLEVSYKTLLTKIKDLGIM
jgi:DNA-binding NtrC family response regulator